MKKREKKYIVFHRTIRWIRSGRLKPGPITTFVSKEPDKWKKIVEWAFQN